eukprot:216323_1
MNCVFNLVIVALAKAEIATPTMDDGYTQIYNTTTADEYKFDDFICKTSICHIICAHEQSCKTASINASMSDLLLLECSAVSSCVYLTVSSQPQKQADIICDYYGSCDNSVFYLTSTPIVNVIADSSSVTLYAEKACNVTVDCGNCFVSSFYVNESNIVHFRGNHAIIYGYGIKRGLIVTSIGSAVSVFCPYASECNIICDETCESMSIFIDKTKYDRLKFNCNNSDTSMCSSVRFHCATRQYPKHYYTFSWVHYSHQYEMWKCSSHECCFIKDDVYECPSNVDCIIDCQQQTCANWEIDASDAKSLVIDCSLTSVCEGIHINCPRTENSVCEIRCAAPWSCAYSIINSIDSRNGTFILHCDAESACRYAIINVFSSLMNTFSMTCAGRDVCQDAYVEFDFEYLDYMYWNITESPYLNTMDHFLLSYTPNDTYNISIIENFNLLCNGQSGQRLVDAILPYDNFKVVKFNFSSVNCECLSIHVPIVNSAHLSLTRPQVYGGYGCIDIDIELLELNSTVDIFIDNAEEGMDDSINVYSMEPLSNDSNHKVNVNSSLCSYSEYHFSNIFEVTLYCGSMRHTDVFASDTSHLKVFNPGYGSAIYCPFKKEHACNIDCSLEYTCKNTTIHVNDEYVMDYLNISCWGQDQCSNVAFYCDANDAFSNKSKTFLVFTEPNQYQCDAMSTFDCCPFRAIPTAHPTITTASPTMHTNPPSKLSDLPTSIPTNVPSAIPTYSPSAIPTDSPSAIPTDSPSAIPTDSHSVISTYSHAIITTSSVRSTITNSEEQEPNAGSDEPPTSQTLSLDTHSTLFILLISVSTVDVVLITICLYYIVTKLSKRSKTPGNASYMDTLKSFKAVHYIGIVVDLFDIVTDYLFAASLIVGDNASDLILCGWVSLCFAIIGLATCLFKYGTFRKLIALQATQLKKNLESCPNEERKDEIIKQIRYREMDINVISLLNGCIEDLPQTMIVLITTSSVAWSYISVLTISLSMLSFTLKIYKIIATKLGCEDQSMPDAKRVQLSFIMEQSNRNTTNHN